MKTFFVTGGAGFIGGNFILNLMKSGQAKVVNYDKLTYAGNLDTLSSLEGDPNYFFEQGDICDKDKLTKLFESYEIDYVVHFAAESHVDRSIDAPGDFIQTNVVGTFELLEAARWFVAQKNLDRKKNFRFLHISTDEVYGSLGDTGLFTEETPYAPNSPYAASKASSELTTLKPNPPVVRLTTNDLPLPGPPAMKNALNMLGSYTPSCSSVKYFIFDFLY